MAQSTCPKCGGHSFEIVENTPNKSAWTFYFIQCASCGCVVGTHEYYNVGNLIHKLAEKLRIKLD